MESEIESQKCYRRYQISAINSRTSYAFEIIH